MFIDSDLPFKFEIIAYLQHSHTDLHAQRPEYDKETHKFSVIHWSPSTIKPVIFLNHEKEHDGVNRKKWHK